MSTFLPLSTKPRSASNENERMPYLIFDHEFNELNELFLSSTLAVYKYGESGDHSLGLLMV